MKKAILSFLFICLIDIRLEAQTWPKNYPQFTGSDPLWVIEGQNHGYDLNLDPFNLNFTYTIISKTAINGNILWKKYIGNVALV